MATHQPLSSYREKKPLHSSTQANGTSGDAAGAITSAEADHNGMTSAELAELECCSLHT